MTSQESEEIIVERESLEDLGKILTQGRKIGVRLLLIGGYAVAAYTKGYRYTKDIDLVAEKQSLGRLRGLLNSMGYSIRKTDFGIAGTKRLGSNGDNNFIDLHISIGNVHDISTNSDFTVGQSIFKKANRLEVEGFYSKTTVVRAPVVDLETILILKFIPTGRDKDAVDLISLITDRGSDVDFGLMKKLATESKLNVRLLESARDYAARVKKGQLDKIWSGMTGARLSFTQKRRLLQFLAGLADQLRS
ncbi:MAG: nucleotidyl transferase AbiEii/AbiGii toxin family protein [Nitrososphaerota archaeon]|nr:nucleotidyl transferase AbiEii/AbiGii toxin family protein [Nitrososphaerota archaeon]